MTNRVKNALRDGQAVFGPIIQVIGYPAIVQLIAAAEFDFAYFDMEHGPFTTSQISELCQVARATGIVPIVRPPSHAAHHLTRPLDAGALGLLVPHVETAVQARAIVQQAKYHPLGLRGFSGRGAHTNYERQLPKTMMARANDDTLIAVMVESIRGIEHVDEIASVPGIDAIVIGRGDLSQDMGIPGEVESPRVEAAIDRVLDTCQQQNIAAGILCFDTESAEQWLARGIRLLNYSSDVALIVDTATKALETVRGFCDEQDILILRPGE